VITILVRLKIAF